MKYIGGGMCFLSGAIVNVNFLAALAFWIFGTLCIDVAVGDIKPPEGPVKPA